MEKSCGIVLFSSDEFLLIQHPTKSNGDEGHWDFPKGHVEGSETELETAKRELIEETGIVNFRLFDGFKHRIEYNFQKANEIISKEVWEPKRARFNEQLEIGHVRHVQKLRLRAKPS